MSLVTNVLVHAASIDGHFLTQPQPWDEREQALGDLSGMGSKDPRGWYPYWGGTKVPEWHLYGAAFNYLDWDGFVAWIEGLPLAMPERIMVLRKGEEEDLPSVWVLYGGALVEMRAP